MLRSRNYAPPPELVPFVRQLFVFRASLPDDFELIDQLISETMVIRVLLSGDWSARFGNGEWRQEGPALLFGQNSRSFTVRVRGPFAVVGVALRPSGSNALFDAKADKFTDSMFALSDIWGDCVERAFAPLVGSDAEDAVIIAAIEACVHERLGMIGTFTTDLAMAAFEEIARTDSTMRVSEAAEHVGLSGRALERRCCATFGLTPKTILRRSRFLDMAAAVRGMSQPDDEERAALRFSDQSHLNREFRHFIGMTPGQFERTPTPLLDAVLKLRADGIS